MLTPELSRLKGAPVCSVGHRESRTTEATEQEKSVLTPEPSKARRFQSRPASHVHARPTSQVTTHEEKHRTVIELKATAEPEIAARELEK